MANYNRKFGNNTPLTQDLGENTKKEEAKTGTNVGDSKRNDDVWEQARLQVKDTFGGLDEKAQNDAIQARYDSMIESDKQVKKWAGNDSAILGDV